MLHPKQFSVNEAWIAFKLNDAPIHTELDGDFNCMALMDAASCFILTVEMFPVTDLEPSKLVVRRMLRKSHAHKQEFPQKLFIPSQLSTDNLVLEAQLRNIAVTRVPEEQLLLFIGEAREGFKARFSGGEA